VLVVGLTVTMEIKEICAQVGSLFNTVEDTDASNGHYLTVESGNNSLGNPPTAQNERVRFNVEISKEGPYNIFARVKAPSSTDDSFWVRVNEGTWVRWNQIEPSTSFIWDQVHDNTNNNTPVSFYFENGENTIDFAYREDGAALDKIFISQGQIAPEGLGAEAENCECYDGNYNGTYNSDGTVTITATGGVGPYIYHWSNNACTDYEENLEEGTYTITVTDANGCEEICSVEVETELPIYLQCLVMNNDCDGTGNSVVYLETSVNANALTYEWSNGATTPTLSNVEPGTYGVTVTSIYSGCTKSCETTVTPASPFSINCEATPTTCGATNDGTVTVTATGGVGR